MLFPILPRFDLPEFDVKTLDAVVISHAHLDHCGLVPDIASRGTPIVSTPVTGDLAERMAQDTLRVSEIENYPRPFHPTEPQKFYQNCIAHGPIRDISRTEIAVLLGGKCISHN